MPRLLLAVVPALLLSGCAGEPRTWKDLQQALAQQAPEQRDALIEQFISARGGTPLIENQTRLVFLAKDRNGVAPRIVGDFNAWASTPRGYDATVGTPTRIEGSSWSYLESTAYTNARLEYVFLFDKETVPDPMNRRVVQAAAGPLSEARMPYWVGQPEIDDTKEVAKGELIAETITSRALKGSRRVWFYLPAGYQASSDTLYPVLYVLDGGNYVEQMDVPRVLDRLIAAGRIPPVVAVFTEPGNRQEEYSRSQSWRTFVTSELVPLVDKRFRTFPAPDHRLVLGSSLAAYGAVDLAVEFPSLFGLCAAVAPPVQTSTLITNQAKAQQVVVSLRFFVLGGIYDSSLEGARRLRSALETYSAPVTYVEVQEGHNVNTFRAHLDDAVIALLTAAPQ